MQKLIDRWFVDSFQCVVFRFLVISLTIFRLIFHTPFTYYLYIGKIGDFSHGYRNKDGCRKVWNIEFQVHDSQTNHDTS